jgi:iron complex outermembrane recepter protein
MGQAEINGKILDKDYRPLIGANVILLPDSVLRITDGDGGFSFKNIVPGDYKLVVQYIGYETVMREVSLRANRPVFIEVEMESGTILLESVEVREEHTKLEGSSSTEHLHAGEILHDGQGTLGKALEKVPGMRSLNLGVGISKPMIRGLANQRIVVQHLGIKQEGHQWGTDHGLEIDPFSAERVEIIKGAASLQYGSDALGGVVNIQPNRIPQRDHMVGELRTQYKSNNDHLAYTGKWAYNKDGFFVLGRFTRQRYSDFRVPAESFTYNQFTLPLVDGALKNTAGLESSWLAEAGYQNQHSITRFSYAEYDLNAGLFPGAVGIPRAYILEPDGDPRDISLPSQDVNHRKAVLSQTLFFDHDHITWHLGWQQNHRIERSFPEFHQIPLSTLEPGDDRSIDLQLTSWTADVHYEIHHLEERKSIFGASYQKQDNRRGGFSFLLPDFSTDRLGVFFIHEKIIGNEWMIHGGLRGDYGRNRSDAFRQFIWSSQETVIDSLVVPGVDDSYFNVSGSLGVAWAPEDAWELRANVGKSFRVPYPSELVSNGIHHGTFRHERGTPGLSSEHGYQVDISATKSTGSWSFDGGLFANYFAGYIYLSPSGSFSTLPEAGQLWVYRQDNAIFGGFEARADYRIGTAGSEIELGVDAVWNRNLDTGLPLPFSPPPRAWLAGNYTLPIGGLAQLFSLDARVVYTAAQNRVDRNELTTPGYWLVHAGVSGDFRWRKQKLNVRLYADNLFDVRYLNHLSRYRLLNLPEQGRNIVLSLHIPFDWHIH